MPHFSRFDAVDPTFSRVPSIYKEDICNMNIAFRELSAIKRFFVVIGIRRKFPTFPESIEYCIKKEIQKLCPA